MPADVQDEVYGERDGRYYIDGVTVDFGLSGARRKVEIGIRIMNEKNTEQVRRMFAERLREASETTLYGTVKEADEKKRTCTVLVGEIRYENILIVNKETSVSDRSIPIYKALEDYLKKRLIK
ncbi:hypothetical protein Barb6XT_03063 [Bacteroidales bacterium Barb6XT]|nr:hypothetical protein Barb6XT_03063 [Bacteroidales bacterium Barb6XT]